MGAAGPPRHCPLPTAPAGRCPTSTTRPATVGKEAEPLLQLQGFQGLLGHSLVHGGGPPWAGVCSREDRRRQPSPLLQDPQPSPRRTVGLSPHAVITMSPALSGPRTPWSSPNSMAGPQVTLWEPHCPHPAVYFAPSICGCKAGPHQQRALPHRPAEPELQGSGPGHASFLACSPRSF